MLFCNYHWYVIFYNMKSLWRCLAYVWFSRIEHGNNRCY